MRKIFFVFFFEIFSAIFAGESTRFSNSESVQHQLRQSLLRAYPDDSIRPVRKPTDTVNVSVTCVLYQIANVDQVANAIKLTLGLKMRWSDVFLQWDPADYDGIDRVFLPAHKIWTPELSVWYSTERSMIQVPSDDLDVRIMYTGEIYYFASFTSRSLCPYDVKKFPFDVQQCKIEFGSMSHSSDTLLLTPNNEVILSSFYDNQEWELQDAVFEHEYYSLSSSDTPYSIAALKISFKRQPFFYIFTVVMPTALITFVALVAFHTPLSSRPVRYAKFQIAVVTLMSMSVLMLTIVNKMPRFSMQTVEGQRGSFSSPPLLAVYYFCLLSLVGISTVTSSVLVIWDRQIRFGGKVPRPLWVIMWVAEKLGCGEAGKRRYHQDNFEMIRIEKISNEDAEEECNDIPASPLAEGPIASCDKQLRQIRNIVAKIEHDMDKFAKTRKAEHPSYTIVRFIEQALFYFYIGLLFTLVFMFFYNDWY